MGQKYDKARTFAATHRKMLIAIVSAVLGVLFILSILLSVFAGGEFTSGDADTKTKGIIRLNDTRYGTTYFTGDKFSFDKENASITLVAKDNVLDRVIRVDELPAPEYGFMVNGQGDIIYEPDQITMTQDIKTIDVVSKAYPDVRETIDVSVYGSLDTSKLTDTLEFEAENTDLYYDGKLLTQEEKAVQPTPEQPFLANVGNTGTGYDPDLLSGGNCLRNFQTNDMRLEFKIVASETATVELTITICQRTKALTFGSCYTFELNGQAVTSVDDIEVPAGSGYFMPYDIKVDVELVRGVNTLSFISGESIGKINPFNFDALSVLADGAVVAGMDAVTA